MNEASLFLDATHRQYVLDAFLENGDFSAIMDTKMLETLLDRIIELDKAYIEDSSINTDAIYDADAAYDYMFTRMCESHIEYRAYMMRFVEDYMDYTEAYLESAGLIEWI